MSFRLLACPSCYARFEPRGTRPRCPVCGTRFDQAKLREPAAPDDEDPNLETPAFLLEEELVEQNASHLTVAAAVVCFTALAFVIGGFVFASPLAFIGGFIVIFVVVTGFGIHDWWVKAKELWRRQS